MTVVNKINFRLKSFFKKKVQYKKSFSQSGEDLIVKYIFDILNIYKPSYLDIGAHHPTYLSNSALLYLNGSKGINIEPDPLLFKKFLKGRKNDINLNIGISDKEEVLDFYILNNPTLNTFSKKKVKAMAKRVNILLPMFKK